MSHWTKIIEGCKQQDPRSQEELYRGCYAGMIKLCVRFASDKDEAAGQVVACIKPVTTLTQEIDNLDFKPITSGQFKQDLQMLFAPDPTTPVQASSIALVNRSFSRFHPEWLFLQSSFAFRLAA